MSCVRGYHLDISKIQHHLNVDISAIELSLSTLKCYAISVGYEIIWQCLAPVKLNGIALL